MRALPEMLTTAQAAAFLAVKPRTMIRWRFRGGGPPYAKLGYLVRYAREDLEAFKRGAFVHSRARGVEHQVEVELRRESEAEGRKS